MTQAPIEHKGLVAIGPRMSHSSSTRACFFLPSFGFGHSARRTIGSAYAQFRRGSRTTSPRFVCSSPMQGLKSCSAAWAASSIHATARTSTRSLKIKINK